MAMSIELLAARYRLGLATAQDAVQSAVCALLEGRDSESLRILSGEILADESSVSIRELGSLLERTLQELDVALPDTEGAYWIVLRHHLSQIAGGEVSPRAGTEAIIAEVYMPRDNTQSDEEYAGESLGIAQLLGNYWSFDELEARPDEVSVDGLFGAAALDALEAHMRADAEKWLAIHGF